MGQATSLAHRKSIVVLREAGKTHTAISEELSIPLSTVKLIWLRYKKDGEQGLSTNYHHSGVKTIRSNKLMCRAALWLRRLHPSWGAGRIRIGLLSRYSVEIIPSERTMQRWFAEKKSNQTQGTKC